MLVSCLTRGIPLCHALPYRIPPTLQCELFVIQFVSALHFNLYPPLYATSPESSPPCRRKRAFVGGAKRAPSLFKQGKHRGLRRWVLLPLSREEGSDDLRRFEPGHSSPSIDLSWNLTTIARTLRFRLTHDGDSAVGWGASVAPAVREAMDTLMLEPG
eukprot:COSAG02_NODE_32663_length_512_cov_1.922518_1_plen_157_part_10